MTPGPPLLVVAGDRQQFNLFCRMNELNPNREAVYVMYESSVRGYMNPNYVLTGTWFNKSWKEMNGIFQSLKMCFAKDVSERYETT